jgi:hypothetical protein
MAEYGEINVDCLTNCNHKQLSLLLGTYYVLHSEFPHKIPK